MKMKFAMHSTPKCMGKLAWFSGPHGKMEKNKMKKLIHRNLNLSPSVRKSKALILSAISPLIFARWIGLTRFLRVATALLIFIKFNIADNTTDHNQKPYRLYYDFHEWIVMIYMINKQLKESFHRNIVTRVRNRCNFNGDLVIPKMCMFTLSTALFVTRRPKPCAPLKNVRLCVLQCTWPFVTR
jgi:hypothetical protein